MVVLDYVNQSLAINFYCHLLPWVCNGAETGSPFGIRLGGLQGIEYLVVVERLGIDPLEADRQGDESLVSHESLSLDGYFIGGSVLTGV